MKIYTKTGDEGQTSLFGGERVSKDHLRIQAYGSIDECNAVLGLAQNSNSSSILKSLLQQIQNQLFVVGADLASPESTSNQQVVKGKDVQFLESNIDILENSLEPLKTFILPGGTQTASFLHLARTICRRAERHVVSLKNLEENADFSLVLKYLNRLSDLLFVASRFANKQEDIKDIPWDKI